MNPQPGPELRRSVGSSHRSGAGVYERLANAAYRVEGPPSVSGHSEHGWTSASLRPVVEGSSCQFHARSGYVARRRAAC